MHHSTQRGLAIWYILAGVVLFAIVSYAFVRGVNNSSSGSDRGQARIQANEILRYAESIDQAVQRLRMVNGCSENDISFYSEKWDDPSDYDNTYTPESDGDYSCHVFHRDGGGVEWQKPPGDNGNNYVFTGNLKIVNIGTDSSANGTSSRELLLMLGGLKEEVCKSINRELNVGLPNIPKDDDEAPYSDSSLYFRGSFLDGKTIGNSLGTIRGRNSLCYIGDDPSQNTRIFYHILIAR